MKRVPKEDFWTAEILNAVYPNDTVSRCDHLGNSVYETVFYARSSRKVRAKIVKDHNVHPTKEEHYHA